MTKDHILTSQEPQDKVVSMSVRRRLAIQQEGQARSKQSTDAQDSGDNTGVNTEGEKDE